MANLSTLTSVQFALLKVVADVAGIKTKELRQALGLSEYKLKQAASALKSQGFITYQDSQSGKAHKFFLGQAVAIADIETEQRRRGNGGCDFQARTAVRVIHRKLKELVMELDEVLTER